MLLKIALAGDAAGNAAALESAEKHIDKLKEYFRIEDSQLLFLESPLYTGEAWRGSYRIKGLRTQGFCTSSDADGASRYTSTVTFDTRLRSIVGETMCNEADILLMIWSENVSELNGASWELMQTAYRKKLPCIWVSATDNRVYWLKDSFYEVYDDTKLKALADTLCMEPIEPIDDDPDSDLFMLSFWKRARLRYLKKHDAERNVYDAEKDAVMTDDFEAEDACDAEIRNTLLSRFNAFDKAAVALNTKYQTIIYMRSVMPILASVFISIGFYIETLFGIFGIPAYILSIAAGIGFLIHGLLNLYVYALSKNDRIKNLHENFINNRSLAEILRVMIHLLPYGVSMDLRKLCGDNQRGYVTVKSIADKPERSSTAVDKKTVNIVLGHLKEMLDDQRSYHSSSGKRYENIVKKLDKWSKLFFSIGFTTVLLRALLQFVVSLPPVKDKLDISFFGANLNSYIKSFANMAALMLPAIASYFSAKAVQCNFRYNMENHNNMLSVVDSMYKKITDLEQADTIQTEVLSVLGDEVAELMLINDTSAWRHKYMSVKVTHM